jgi:hypothetical protein
LVMDRIFFIILIWCFSHFIWRGVKGIKNNMYVLYNYICIELCLCQIQTQRFKQI